MAKAVISNVSDHKVVSISNKNYVRSTISYTRPFRVKFINIGVPNYNANFPPPIGIAIIGVNNYIL